MKNTYSFEEIKRAEEEAVRGGRSSFALMERAGEELSRLVLSRVKEGEDVLFVCGNGNNGGDGFAAARRVLEAGREAAVLCPFETLSPDCAKMKSLFKGEIFGRPPRRRYAFLVDCVLGTGISRPPEGIHKDLIGFVNSCGGYVVSCDLPSGLSENGIAFSPCVKADVTLSIGGIKSALYLADGADLCGEIVLGDIGLSPMGGAGVFEKEDAAALFPRRKSHSHKGNFGNAAFWLERGEYSGAVLLSASACLRSGAGYTSLFASEEILPALIGKLPSVVLRRADFSEWMKADAIAYGMGAGGEIETFRKTERLLKEYKNVLILDADALNALSAFGLSALKEKSCKTVLTPHIGEFARLIKKSAEETLKNARAFAESFAREYGVTLVLKNNRTIVTDGQRTSINPTGCSALAKGGSGDLLSGLLAGTCARGIEPFEAACAACYLLGEAGELAQRKWGEYSSTPSAVSDLIPEAIQKIQENIE